MATIIAAFNADVFRVGDYYYPRGNYDLDVRGAGTDMTISINPIGGKKILNATLLSTVRNGSNAAYASNAAALQAISAALKPASGSGAVVVNSTTAALSKATLNSTYPDASFGVGTRVYCQAISGGGLVYQKTGTDTWSSSAITAVA